MLPARFIHVSFVVEWKLFIADSFIQLATHCSRKIWMDSSDAAPSMCQLESWINYRRIISPSIAEQTGVYLMAFELLERIILKVIIQIACVVRENRLK